MEYGKIFNRYGRNLIITAMVLLTIAFLAVIAQKKLFYQAGYNLPEKEISLLICSAAFLLCGFFIIIMYVAERKNWEKLYNILPVCSIFMVCTVLTYIFHDIPAISTIYLLGIFSTVVYGKEQLEWGTFLLSFLMEFAFLGKMIHDSRANFYILSTGINLLFLLLAHIICTFIIRTEAEKAKLQEETKNRETRFLIKSYTDALTSLPNVEALKRRGERWLNKRGSYYVMIDLDKFKRVNDTYGHEFGNVVLKRLANLLYEYRNDNLFVGRYGGEEFSIIFHGYSLGHAVEVLDMIRRDFNSFLYKDVPEQFSFSAGIAPLQGEVLSSIKAADEKLYEAKTSGRNRICS